MISSTKRTHRIKKWGFAQAAIIAMILMSALAAIGTGYGSMTGTLETGGTANAGLISYTAISTSEGCIAGHIPGETKATLAMENAYPGLSCTAQIEITNTGAIPLSIRRIALEESPHIAIEIEGIATGQEIAAGEAIQMEINQEVLETAPQNTILKYTLAIEIGQ